MRPWYQRLAAKGSYIGLGFLALGAILDSVSNAISLVTPSVARAGTIVLLSFWIAVEVGVKLFKVRWVRQDGTPSRVSGLGVQPRLAFVGAVALL